MAKGNMFQGMARGKVGDVVFSRLNGEQISRVRNRNPRNPKSNGQLYQRAIMATIMQAYSAGKRIFDHSFEGYAVGAGNQREYMKLNAKALRSVIASEIQNNTDYTIARGRVVAPGIKTPVGFDGMIVSEGNYAQRLFTVTPVDFNSTTPTVTEATFKLPAPLANETCAEYAVRNNIIAGDYYTIVGFLGEMTTEALFYTRGVRAPQGHQYPCNFFFVRMTPKAAFLESTDAVAAKKYADLFEIESISDNVNASTLGAMAITEDCNGDEVFNKTLNEGGWYWWFGIIRSRLDQDLRSNTSLVQGAYNQMPGIVSPFVLQAWQQGAVQVGDSELILEGGNFQEGAE